MATRGQFLWSRLPPLFVKGLLSDWRRLALGRQQLVVRQLQPMNPSQRLAELPAALPPKPVPSVSNEDHRGVPTHRRSLVSSAFPCREEWLQQGRTVRCAKTRLFWPVFPGYQGDRRNYCVPIHRTTQTLTQSKHSDNDRKQTMFHTENARLLSKSAVFALWTYAPPVLGFQSGHGKLTYYWVMCPRCAEMPPMQVPRRLRQCMAIGSKARRTVLCIFHATPHGHTLPGVSGLFFELHIDVKKGVEVREARRLPLQAQRPLTQKVKCKDFQCVLVPVPCALW